MHMFCHIKRIDLKFSNQYSIYENDLRREDNYSIARNMR